MTANFGIYCPHAGAARGKVFCVRDDSNPEGAMGRTSIPFGVGPAFAGSRFRVQRASHLAVDVYPRGPAWSDPLKIRSAY